MVACPRRRARRLRAAIGTIASTDRILMDRLERVRVFKHVLAACWATPPCVAELVQNVGSLATRRSDLAPTEQTPMALPPPTPPRRRRRRHGSRRRRSRRARASQTARLRRQRQRRARLDIEFAHRLERVDRQSPDRSGERKARGRQPSGRRRRLTSSRPHVHRHGRSGREGGVAVGSCRWPFREGEI